MQVTSSPEKAADGSRAANWYRPAAATPPKRKRSKGERAIRRIGWNLLPPLTFVAIVALWWGAVELFKIPAYLLPGPQSVFARLVTDAGLLWTHSKVTLTEILLGFGLTIVTAIPLGLLIALSPLSKQLVYPPIMLMQLVPKIAVAPLFLVWLGFGMESKVLLTVLLTFFPLLIASISGFQILDDRGHRHPRAFQNPRAAYLAGNTLHRRTLRPIKTCHGSAPRISITLSAKKEKANLISQIGL